MIRSNQKDRLNASRQIEFNRMKNTQKQATRFCRIRFFDQWSRWNLKFIISLSSFALASLAISAETHWPITVPELTRDELIAVALPSPLFANGHVDATTLRVRDNQGVEIPARYESLQTVRHASRKISTTPFAIIAAEMPDSALRLTLRRPHSKAGPIEKIEGLTIQTPLRDFEQEVKVEISDDGVTWVTVVEQAALFDFSRHADVRRSEIAFPSGITNLNLRLTFEQAVDAREQLTALITATQLETGGTTESRAVQVDTRPFHVESVRGWTSSQVEASRQPVLIDYPIDWKPLTNGVPRGKMRYVIHASGQPLTHLDLAVSADYVSWPYTLTSDSTTTMPPLARGIIKQFRFRGITDAATTIAFSETRTQRYLLTFDHPLAEVTDITAKGPRYRVIFPAQPNLSYTLIQFQKSQKRLPDTTQIITLLARDIQPIEGTLEVTPHPVAAQQRGYDWLRRHFLHIGIAAALVALTFSLGRAIRRL